MVYRKAFTDPKKGVLRLAWFIPRIAFRVYLHQHGFIDGLGDLSLERGLTDTLANMTLEHAPVEICLAHDTEEILMGGTGLFRDIKHIGTEMEKLLRRESIHYR